MKHAREFLQLTIYKVWREEQEEYFQQLASLDEGLQFGGDGRVVVLNIVQSPTHAPQLNNWTKIKQNHRRSASAKQWGQW